MAPRETENNAYAKFWGDKQRTLWYVMVFLEWSIKQIVRAKMTSLDAIFCRGNRSSSRSLARRRRKHKTSTARASRS